MNKNRCPASVRVLYQPIWRMVMNKKAFTLIELLVVIAIIALLLAILMPALGIVKKKAQAVVCASNVGQISKAWFMYAEDNKGMVVGSSTPVVPGDDGPWVCAPQTEAGVSKTMGSEVEEKFEGYKRGALWSYYKSPKLLHCPGDKRSLKPPVDPFNEGLTGKGGYRSYSIVDGLNGGNYGAISIKRQSQIKRPSEKIVFLEEADGRGFNVNSWVMSLTTDKWTDPFSIWHKDSSSLGFADGHAVNHKWLDEDTIDMAEKQTFHYSDPGSEDIKYVQEHYPHAGLK